jgi:hypothetical protein
MVASPTAGSQYGVARAVGRHHRARPAAALCWWAVRCRNDQAGRAALRSNGRCTPPTRGTDRRAGGIASDRSAGRSGPT